jgi:hypothetical protein
MIPAAFEYQRADSAEAALSVLAEHGDEAKLLAGGHSLLPLMKLRLATPSVLVDIGRLSDLSFIRAENDHIAIGALTRHRDLEISDVLATDAPILAHAAGEVGDPQVRHRGTIGGSIAHGDPASDLPAVLLALDATMVIQGQSGVREVSADDFFVGFLETAIGPDELLTEIRVPRVPNAGLGDRWRGLRAPRRPRRDRPRQHGFRTPTGFGRRGGRCVGSVGDRRRQRGRRRHRAARRSQRLGRIPPPPRPSPHPPSPRTSHRLRIPKCDPQPGWKTPSLVVAFQATRVTPVT